MPEGPTPRRIVPKYRLERSPLPVDNHDSLTQRLRHAFRTAGGVLGRLLLPQTCVLCNLPSGNAPVCTACTADLPVPIGLQCSRCALPLQQNPTGMPISCPDCAHHQPAFDTAVAAWSYSFPVDALIQDFKYGHHLYLAAFFGQHLAQSLKNRWEMQPGVGQLDLIIPMPLHANRLKSRGFNQAAEIARHVSKHLDVPWCSNRLVRLYDTAPQAGLHRNERWANLRGAFACPKPLPDARVLLIDDVLTTGASLSACAEALRYAGARRVDVAVIARTPEPGRLN